MQMKYIFWKSLREEHMEKRSFGDFGEEMAAQYLRRQGYAILARNYRCRFGELDVIAEQGDELVICEVKTRASDAYGYPAEAVGRRKMKSIRSAAKYFVSAAGMTDKKMRFDIIEIYLNQIEGAF